MTAFPFSAVLLRQSPPANRGMTKCHRRKYSAPANAFAFNFPNGLSANVSACTNSGRKCNFRDSSLSPP